VYSNEKAKELGATPQSGGDKGFKYNKGWGYLDRYTLDGSGNRISHGQEVVNERVNYFFKPQINLNHFWNVTDRLFVSTVLYASKGTGGGSQAAGSTLSVDAAGQDDFQKAYDNNYKSLGTDGQRLSTQYLVNNVNSHRWYGLVSGFDYLLKPSLTLSAGVDARYYYGIHYREIRDLLGGDYAIGSGSAINRNADINTRLRVGDKFGFYNDSKTGWLGGYGQLEYKTPLLSAVVSGTVSRISYARIDYFRSKQVTLDGKSYDVPYGATPLVVNGQSYTNADGHYLENDWVNITGYSVKAGANYNLTEHDNLFANVGYNSKVPFYQFVFNNSGQKFNDIRNEGISSFEVGYGINYPSLKVTLNAYYTYWANKSSNSISANPGGGTLYNNVRNVDARHMGIEMSVAQEISRRLQLNAAISLGDWRWAGNGVLNQTDDNNQTIGTPDTPIYLKGVHVGDAAQNQFQIGLRYEPFNNFYIRPSFLLFTKYYAGFDPTTLISEASRTDTYRVPTSRNLDIHLGYDLPKRLLGDKVRLGLKGSVLNVLNEFYISDVPASTSATNPSLLQGFFNRGRTFTVGLSATL
jgi:iron complex outermembrane recepter protein